MPGEVHLMQREPLPDYAQRLAGWVAMEMQRGIMEAAVRMMNTAVRHNADIARAEAQARAANDRAAFYARLAEAQRESA